MISKSHTFQKTISFQKSYFPKAHILFKSHIFQKPIFFSKVIFSKSPSLPKAYCFQKPFHLWVVSETKVLDLGIVKRFQRIPLCHYGRAKNE
jgi:hypothetical protein